MDERRQSLAADDLAVKDLREALEDVSVQVLQLRLDIRRAGLVGHASSKPKLVARAAVARLKAFAVELAELRARGG